MAALQLNADERDLLIQVLKNYLATLEVEICHTDHADFRRLLKERRDLLTRVTARLEPRGVALE